MYPRYLPPQQDSKSNRFSNNNYTNNHRIVNNTSVAPRQQQQQHQQHQIQRQPQRQQQSHSNHNERSIFFKHQQQNSDLSQSYSYSVGDDVNWKFRKFRSILNKITPETFDKLSNDIINVGLDSPPILRGVIHLIFDKAIRDSKFCALYATLCQRLCKETTNYETQPGPNTFCRILISKCEAEFERRRQASLDFEGRSDLTEDEFEQKIVAKQNMLANIKFICELRKNDFIEESIIHECIRELLSQKRKHTLDLSEDLECLCQIMKTIGSLLDVESSKNLMDQYFDRMDLFSKKQELPPRIRFMLRDVIDLRYNNWKPRPYQREETNPQMISKIREESIYQQSSGSLTSVLEKMCSSRHLIGKNELAKLHGADLKLLLDDDEPSFTTSVDHFGPGPNLIPLTQQLSSFSIQKPASNRQPQSASSSPPTVNPVVSKTINNYMKNSHSASNVEFLNKTSEMLIRQKNSTSSNTVSSQLNTFKSEKPSITIRQQSTSERTQQLFNDRNTNQVVNHPHNETQSLRKPFIREPFNHHRDQQREPIRFQNQRERVYDKDYDRNHNPGVYKDNPKDKPRFRENSRQFGPSEQLPRFNQPNFVPRIDGNRGHINSDRPEWRRVQNQDQRSARYNGNNTSYMDNYDANQNSNFNSNHNGTTYNRNSNHVQNRETNDIYDHIQQNLPSDTNGNWRFSQQEQQIMRHEKFNKHGPAIPTIAPSHHQVGRNSNINKNQNYRNPSRVDFVKTNGVKDRSEHFMSRDSGDKGQIKNDQSAPVVKLTPTPSFLSNPLINDPKNVSLRPSYNLLSKNLVQTSSQPSTPSKSNRQLNDYKKKATQSSNDSLQNRFTSSNNSSKIQPEVGNSISVNNDGNESKVVSSTDTVPNSISKDKHKESIIAKFDFILNEYLCEDQQDINATMTRIKDLKVQKIYQHDCLMNLMKLSIRRSDTDKEILNKLLINLVPSTFESDALLKALESILKQMQALEVETPKVKSHVAGLLARAIADGLVTLPEVGESLDGGKYHPLFLLCLQKLEKIVGQAVLNEKFTSSKIDLVNMLPEADRPLDRLVNVLRDRSLAFLYPMLTIEPDLWAQMSEPNSTPSSVYKWIRNNVGQTLQESPVFAHVIITCLLRKTLDVVDFEKQSSNENLTECVKESEMVDVETKGTSNDLDKNQLTKYQTILQTILKDKKMQLAALHASQAYFFKIDFPKGIFLRWFHLLYELNIVDDEVFFAWKEEINDEVPGKGKALFQVNSWLNWIASADSDDDEELESES